MNSGPVSTRSTGPSSDNATDPYQIALRLERYLRQTYEYTLDAAADRLLVAVRGLPVRHSCRLLPALRRGHGAATSLQRGPGKGGRGLHQRRTGVRGRLLGVHQQRPRLGGGLFPHRRVGGLRSHSRTKPADTPELRPRARDSRTPSSAALPDPPPSPPRRYLTSSPSRRPAPPARRKTRARAGSVAFPGCPG